MKKNSNGTEFTNLSVAVNKKIKGNEVTNWFSLFAYGKTADLICQYTDKGRLVFVEGEIQSKQQDKRTEYFFVVNHIQFIGGQSDKSDRPSNKIDDFDPGTFISDDIPF